MTDKRYVYDFEERLAYKVDFQGKIIGQYSHEDSKMNAQGKIVGKYAHELRSSQRRGNLVKINGNKYWFFRDAKEQLWIFGDIIDPVKVTAQVTSKIEGEMWKQRRLIVYEGDKIYFTVDYIPVTREDGVTIYFEEDDDFGLFIHNVLHEPERRIYAWSAAWYDKSLR